MTMKDIPTSSPDLQLIVSNSDRDAPSAFAWLNSPAGKDTLLRMGNAENEIPEPSLEAEMARLKEFIQLEEQGEQITRMIVYEGNTIGAVWIELKDTEHVRSPALHIMIGDPLYRGMGLGKEVMKTMIEYIQNELHATTVYSRHLAGNDAISKVFRHLGFKIDGELYTEKSGLTFQNVKL